MAVVEPIEADFAGPDELLRGQDAYVRVSVTQASTAVDITAATVSLVKPDGTVVASESADCTDNEASTTFAGSLTENEDPGEGWLIRWELTLDTTPARVNLQNPAMVVLYSVAPTVTQQTLEDRHAEFLALKTEAEDRAVLLKTAIRDAWRNIGNKLRSKGRRPYLILDSSQLHEGLALHALELAWRRVAQGPDKDEWGQYLDYQAQFKAWWDEQRFAEADPSTWRRTGMRSGGSPTTWLGSGRGTGRYRPIYPGVRTR